MQTRCEKRALCDELKTTADREVAEAEAAVSLNAPVSSYRLQLAEV